MKTAKNYIKEQIPTMVSDAFVSNMKLNTLIGLLNGFANHSAQERYQEAMYLFDNIPLYI